MHRPIFAALSQSLPRPALNEKETSAQNPENVFSLFLAQKGK